MRINPISMVALKPQFGIKKNSEVHFNYSTSPVEDSVSFKGGLKAKAVNVPLAKAKFVANSLSTSTSGHRAEYLSENFTKDIVKLITLGVAGFATAEAAKNNKQPVVLIGGDTRVATRESLPEIKDTLLKQGVNVIEIKDPVPTPLLAMAAKEQNVDLAVLMTASHNNWKDGGYNLVTKAGAIAPAEVTKEVAKEMEKLAVIGTYAENEVPTGTLTELDPFEMYRNNIMNGYINWDNIAKSGLKVYYDGLNGTGNYTVPKLLESFGIPYENVKSKGQDGPNPTDGNLKMLKSEIAKSNDKLRVGLSNDGDADRFGVVDEKGNFVNANDVILLVGYHLAKNKGVKGAVIRSQATSMQLDKLADNYGLKKFETPVGFKYIAEDILDLRKNGEDILVAGEESGGLTINNHIPEKDGVMAISLIMDLITTEGKPLSEILKNVKNELGTAFVINNFSKDLRGLEDADKIKSSILSKVDRLYNRAINDCEDDLGDYHHTINSERTAATKKSMETYRKGGDGVKFVLTDGSTVLVRPSGTEPLVKCYIEATGADAGKAKDNADSLREYMEEFFEQI